MPYVVYFLLAAFVSGLLTPIVRRLALRLSVVDLPDSFRKIHQKPMPLLGGFAIFISFTLVLFTACFFGEINFQVVPVRFLIGLILGGGVLLFGGFLDDKYNLPAKVTWLFPALAGFLVIFCGVGVGITFLTNPFGGTFDLNFLIIGVPASVVFIWFWLMLASYATKLLDGLDGLTSGVGAVAALVMFILSLRPEVNQPSTALLALILAGAILGFLPFAWHPAKIFLGEGGSTFLGFAIGVLAILTGAKIATAVLVMGLPILDVSWSVMRRLASGKSPFYADRKHLHHLLLDAGLTHRQAVLFHYCAAIGLGTAAAFLQSQGKFYAIIILILLMTGLVLGLPWWVKLRAVDKNTR